MPNQMNIPRLHDYDAQTCCLKYRRSSSSTRTRFK